MALVKHRQRTPAPESSWPFAMFSGFPRFFDDLFGDPASNEAMIRVEEFTDGDSFVLRAELPGIDPEKDVEVTVEGDLLHIRAERREEEETSERDFHRRELRYGSFSRTVQLPEGVDDDNVTATYEAGILEVRAPLPAERPKTESRQVRVERR